MQTNKYVCYNLPYLRPNWHKIKQQLQILKDKKYKRFYDLENIINFFQKTSYQFLSLEKYELGYLKMIFSRIAAFVLQVQYQYNSQNSQKFRLFLKSQTRRQTYSKADIILLMCFTALCLNKSTNQEKSKKRLFHDSVNFYSIYQNDHTQKLQFILKYFQHVLNNETRQKEKHQKFIIHRQYNQKPIHQNDLLNIQQFMLGDVLVMKEGSIQDKFKQQSIKIDFANEYIGGGSLGTGCVQEQIMFLNHPQLYVTMILCEAMGRNEAIGMYGFKKYFKNKGYAFNTTYDGFDQSMKYQPDQNGILNDYIVAIDALCYPQNQYSTQQIMREINKSYVGFKIFENVRNISTGNWGCGAFQGDPQLKFIIQWIIATLVNKSIIYYPFGEKKMESLSEIIKILKGKTVGTIMKLILDFQFDRRRISVFQYLFQKNNQKTK